MECENKVMETVKKWKYFQYYSKLLKLRCNPTKLFPAALHACMGAAGKTSQQIQPGREYSKILYLIGLRI